MTASSSGTVLLGIKVSISLIYQDTITQDFTDFNPDLHGTHKWQGTVKCLENKL